MVGIGIALVFLAPPIKIPPRPRAVVAPAPITTSIQLAAKAAGPEVTAAAQPGGTPARARSLLTIRAGEVPHIRWTVRNVDRKAPVQELVVHFLIHAIERPGEPLPASPPRIGSLADSVLGTDLAAGSTTTGTFNTPIHRTGLYVVEVELLDGFGNRRQFCAFDLRVQ